MTSIDFLNKVHKSLDSQEYNLSFSPAKSQNYMLYCNGSFIGGAILCGVKPALSALATGTAQLPQIDIAAPISAISTNTVDCMRSGTVYGTAAMIDGMVARFQQELGQSATVVITGGLGAAIAKYCTVDAVVDRDLLLDGLRIVYQKNQK